VERGAGDDTIRLLQVAEKIYDFDSAEDDLLDVERAKLFRGRIGLAVSSKGADALLHYAQLAFETEERRHKQIGHPTAILAVAYNDLAHAWAFHRDWNQAISLLKVSKEIREQLPDFTIDKLFSPLYHLGLVLQHQGKYQEAEDVLNEAIRDRNNVFGPADAVSIRYTTNKFSAMTRSTNTFIGAGHSSMHVETLD
jgi:tetratricopeptide (TPR) repeat protein